MTKKEIKEIENYFNKYKTPQNTNFILMPEHINVYNGSHERCDTLIGACSCGAWHKERDWKNKIENLEQYLGVNINQKLNQEK